MNANIAPITAERFDVLVRGPSKIWGKEAIAEVLGLSVDTVRRLATVTGTPIYKPHGSKQYFAFRHELIEWLRTSTVREEQPCEVEQRQPPMGDDNLTTASRYAGGAVQRYEGIKS